MTYDRPAAHEVPRLGPDPWRTEVLVLAALAAALRVVALGAPPYGDEAAHFSLARSLGIFLPHVAWLGSNVVDASYHFVVGRPFFYLAHFLPAQFGFAAFRLFSIVVAVGLVLAVDRLLRLVASPVVVRLAIDTVVALGAPFVTWSVRVFPDVLMAMLFLWGLGLYLQRRWAPALLLMVAAVWTKETAMFGLLGLLTSEIAHSRNLRHLTHKVLPLIGATALAVVPLGVSLALGANAPGWSNNRIGWTFVDAFLVSAWLVPILLYALVVRRFDRLCWAWGATVGGYATWRFVLGRGVEAWYTLLPMALSLVLAAAALGVRTRGGRAQTGGRTVAVALGVFLLALVVLPAGEKAVLQPLLDSPFNDPIAAIHHLTTSDTEIQAVQRALAGTPHERIVLIDVPWFYINYPLGADATRVRYHYSRLLMREDAPAENWTRLIRDEGNVLVITDQETELNTQIRFAFAPCQSHYMPPYRIYVMSSCDAADVSLDEP